MQRVRLAYILNPNCLFHGPMLFTLGRFIPCNVLTVKINLKLHITFHTVLNYFLCKNYYFIAFLTHIARSNYLLSQINNHFKDLLFLSVRLIFNRVIIESALDRYCVELI